MANYLQNLQNQSGSYLSQLNNLNNQMKSYGPATASDALKEFSARVGNMAPQYGELRGMESQIQQTPGALMQQYQQEMGGTTGLDPMARLNAIQASMGNQQGTANVMRDTIGQQQGRLEQMANNALGMYQQELAGKQQQYGNINDMYKTILGQIENEKQRQAAASQAAKAAKDAMDLQRYIASLTNKDKGGGTTTINVGPAKSLEELNFLREQKKQKPVDQNYFDTVYKKQTIAQPSYWDSVNQGYGKMFTGESGLFGNSMLGKVGAGILGTLALPGMGALQAYNSIFGNR
jgi:hypothetical protein